MPTSRQGPAYRALLVEDSAADARLVDEMLAVNRQYDLTWVRTAREAEEALGGRGWDVVLLDLNLPDSQGLDTLDRVMAAARGVAVVVLTVMDAGETGAEAVRRGAQDFLVKGKFRAHDVDRAVRYATIRQSITRREASAFAAPVAGPADDKLPKVPLQEREPRRFAALTRAFVEAIQEDVESIAFDHSAGSGWTRHAAEELARSRAGPRDVVDLYLAAMNEAVSHAETLAQRDATANEARLRALELMGYLVAEYRGDSPEGRDA